MTERHHETIEEERERLVDMVDERDEIIERLTTENRQLHHILDSLPERGEMARLRAVLEAARTLIRNREEWEASLAFRDPVAADDADDAYPAVFDALCHAVAAYDTPPASAAGDGEGGA